MADHDNYSVVSLWFISLSRSERSELRSRESEREARFARGAKAKVNSAIFGVLDLSIFSFFYSERKATPSPVVFIFPWSVNRGFSRVAFPTRSRK
jgi:hypothetical protein